MREEKATREEALQFVDEQTLVAWEKEMQHEILERDFSVSESYMFQVSRMHGHFLCRTESVPCKLLQYFCEYAFDTAEVMYAERRTT